MLKEKSSEFAEYFLLSFTEAILKNLIEEKSIPKQEITHQQDMEKFKKSLMSSDEKKGFQKSHINPVRDKNPFSNFNRKFSKEIRRSPKKIFAKKIKSAPKGEMKIPEPKLPEYLQYIKPTPEEAAIELGSIDPLIKDPAVKVIECTGPNERVMVKGAMGVKPTAITLREDEMKSVVEEFSKRAKIPIHDGVYRVAVGRLVLSAIISTVIHPKFIIEKMRYPQKINSRPLRNAR